MLMHVCEYEKKVTVATSASPTGYIEFVVVYILTLFVRKLRECFQKKIGELHVDARVWIWEEKSWII